MSNTLKRAAELLRDGAYDCVVKCHHDECIALASELERMAQVEPVAWKHDCAALLMNDVELWVNNCPHCGKPRTTNQPAVTLARDAQVEPVAWQCKFDGGSEWAMCSYHHHVTVQANKVGWTGYNTRPLYAAPQEPVNQRLLAALNLVIEMDVNGYRLRDRMEFCEEGLSIIYRVDEAIAAAESAK